jgi:hypothetical protein
LIQDGKMAVQRDKTNEVALTAGYVQGLFQVEVKGSRKQHGLKIRRNLVSRSTAQIGQGPTMPTVPFKHGQLGLEMISIAELSALPKVGIPDIVETFNQRISLSGLGWNENDFHPHAQAQTDNCTQDPLPAPTTVPDQIIAQVKSAWQADFTPASEQKLAD